MESNAFINGIDNLRNLRNEKNLLNNNNIRSIINCSMRIKTNKGKGRLIVCQKEKP